MEGSTWRRKKTQIQVSALGQAGRRDLGMTVSFSIMGVKSEHPTEIVMEKGSNLEEGD